jgi:glyoxylase-like metal-dependent hydrolase (beta-lactamase superfamily II)
LLLQVSGKNVLVDTGVGCKEDDLEDESIATVGLSHGKLTRGLKSAGLTPKDIDAVVLSHLHFDHTGGCTRLDRSGELVTSFPNATYYTQRASWEEACHPSDRCPAVHKSENFLPLEQYGQLELLDGDTEILPGLNVVVTGGHSSGHQIVLFNHGGERIAYLGDLIPTPHQPDSSGYLSLRFIARGDPGTKTGAPGGSRTARLAAGFSPRT